MAHPLSGSLLERLPANIDHTFSLPTKRINDGSDLEFFHHSIAYRDLMTWVLQLNRSMFSIKDAEGKIQRGTLDSPPRLSPTVQSLRDLLSALTDRIKEAPPDTGPRRFGNVAFKTWFKLVEEHVGALLNSHLAPLLKRYERQRSTLKEELEVYLLGSFGSAQRLDYGTGHELSFVAFLGCLWKLNVFEDGEERGIVVGVVQPYLELIRKLVLTYTLEPAGSHGVWGLDDHSFVPYIFGSAQLSPALPNTPSTQSQQSLSPLPTEGSLPSAPAPARVSNKDAVADYKDGNMYFSAIQFIYDVKRGPFWEHSPVLYDVSGIKDGWGKINKGMVKMFEAEVLGKFPVVQHFPFGSLWRWENDPLRAVSAGGRDVGSVHAREQPRARVAPPPAAMVSLPVGGSGTNAPWARGGGEMAVPAIQASTGVPSTRAPWAGATARRPPAAPAAATMVPTTAPWAASQKPAAAAGGSSMSARSTHPPLPEKSRSDDHRQDGG